MEQYIVYGIMTLFGIVLSVITSLLIAIDLFRTK